MKIYYLQVLLVGLLKFKCLKRGIDINVPTSLAEIITNINQMLSCCHSLMKSVRYVRTTQELDNSLMEVQAIKTLFLQNCQIAESN